ncbi:MAG: aminomethyl-transferring glycine dehydrogenase subunit GcvPA [Firmicutes bacterium]|jgi:glycine dehydrogenase subunit 1|nr:aminomethyl-transferring glycine dehydrogenase subunit GcvPA [Bacillota bacterium]
MGYPYLPLTPEERQQMLSAIGVESVEELFSDIPREIKLEQELDLPEPLTESELLRHVRELGDGNISLDTHASFLGAGVYQHLVPSAVYHLANRAEFLTAYTPYQAEISQGVLQATFEYQTLVCSLTGMDVANASMYDGATGLAEAALMAINITGGSRVIAFESIHPDYRAVVETYLKAVGAELVVLPAGRGTADPAVLTPYLGKDTAAVLIQQPNFFGLLEPVNEIGALLEQAPTLFVACVNPISLGILQAPAAYGADIAVGDGQPLGNPPAFGGPSFGFMAAREKYIRRMPGRIVGETRDENGSRGFVLTLQTREQHIRRQRATSNICTNAAHSSLIGAIYLALLGKEGLKEVAVQCAQKAHYTAEQIAALPGWELLFEGPYYHEFAVKAPVPWSKVNEALLNEGIIGGLPLGRMYPHRPEWQDAILFCVTEARTVGEIQHLVQVLKGVE